MITKGTRSDVAITGGLKPQAPAGGMAGDAPHRILLIEDDTQIAQLVTNELTDIGCAVDWAADGDKGLNSYHRGRPHLVVLDLNLPDADGLDICEQIRVTDRLTPILMLTARTTKQDIVRGLELGADEYLTKPFDSLELIARIRALFRRIAAYRVLGTSEVEQAPIRHGMLVIDPVRRLTHIGAQPIVLTAKEFDLLMLFAKHPGRTFTRDELLTRVWGDGFEGFEHTVNTHINRLRNKVETDAKKPVLIETVWGVGYRFSDAIL